MYLKSKLISRRGYSGVGGALGGITDFLKTVLNSYGSSQQAQGAATQAQLDAQTRAAAGGGGIGFTDIAIVGAVGLAAAFLFLRKKKS